VLNRVSGILLLTLVALGAIVATEIREGIPSADRAVAAASKQKPQAAPATARPFQPPLPPLESLSETTSRPLFLAERRPPDGEPAPLPDAPLPAGPDPNFSISAIIITDDEHAVLMAHPETGTLNRLKEGEAVAGWTLEQVTPDRAVFTKDGQTKEATLRTFGPPPAPRPKRKPRATGQVVPPAPAAGAQQPAEARAPRRVRRPTRDPSATQPVR
jgi:hypothetical protein